MFKWFAITFIFLILAFIVPFFSFGKSYDQVCLDAARMYGINEGDYEIHFSFGKVLNASGESVNGTFNVSLDGEAHGVYVIQVQKSEFSRSMTVATIFHEFAHAAQHKYNLDLYGNTVEQDAELLAFNTMWRSGYWWDAVHMLWMHSFHFKPSNYLAAKKLWYTALTGIQTVPILEY